MRGHHCEKDVGIKVAAFANHLESTSANQETPNLTTENVELLTKFAIFLQHEKRMHMHSWDGHGHGHHDHKFSKFGKHGHHDFLGHHFGRHGPYGKHRHGHHGHGPHDNSPHGHKLHGYCHGKRGMHGFECRKHNKHSFQHFWKQLAMHKMADPEEIIVIEDECIESERNPSAPSQENTTVDNVPEGSTKENNATCVCERKDRHCGRRWRAHEWVIVRKPAKPQTVTQAALQAETNEPAQENVATMVENITIENAPQKE